MKILEERRSKENHYFKLQIGERPAFKENRLALRQNTHPLVKAHDIGRQPDRRKQELERFFKIEKPIEEIIIDELLNEQNEERIKGQKKVLTL